MENRFTALPLVVCGVPKAMQIKNAVAGLLTQHAELFSEFCFRFEVPSNR